MTIFEFICNWSIAGIMLLPYGVMYVLNVRFPHWSEPPLTAKIDKR